MPNDGPLNNETRSHHPGGTSALAVNAVSMMSKRQSVTQTGARQFILDHLLRAVTATSEFNPASLFDELRGHRLSVDAIIDIYVPAVACLLGEMWQEDEADFATVTVGSMRLQSLLSIASFETIDLIRSPDESPSMLIVLPTGEQHSLGVFVLAAQLRRLGARVEISFSEDVTELVSRVLTDLPDMVLFSASSRATLETIGSIVLDFCKILPEKPFLAVGGQLGTTAEVAKDITGVDLVSTNARQAVTVASNARRSFSERKHK